MFLSTLFVFNINNKETVDKNLLIKQFSCEQTTVRVTKKKDRN